MAAERYCSAKRTFPACSGEPRIGKFVEKARAGDVFAPRRHVRLVLALAAGFEGQLELHPAWIVNKELPERSAGHDELAPVEAGRLEARDIRAKARAGQRHVIDRGRP